MITRVTLLSSCGLLYHRNGMLIPNDERIFKVLFGTAGGGPIVLSQVGSAILVTPWNMLIYARRMVMSK